MGELIYQETVYLAIFSLIYKVVENYTLASGDCRTRLNIRQQGQNNFSDTETRSLIKELLSELTKQMLYRTGAFIVTLCY